ncbi:MAG: hypothetical protein V1861_03775 [Candidatus Micrarchaeota archaeon]
MAGAFDTVVDTLRDAVNFFMKYPARLTLEFVKVVAMGMALQMVLVLLITAIGIGLGREPGTDAASLVAIAVTLLAGIAFFIISSSLSATQFCIVDQMTEGKRINIISKTRELVRPIAVFCGIIIAAFIVVLALGLLSGTVLAGIGGAFLMLLVLIGMITGVFLSQFAMTMIAVRGMDAVSALKNSFTMARQNFWAVLAFDIIILVPILGIIVVLSVPQEMIGQVIASSGADLALSAVLFGVSLALSLIESVLVSLMMTNFIYFFFRRLEGREVVPTVDAPAVPSKKRASRR